MHGTTIDVNQMQPQGKKRRIDWDSLDLNENGSGSSGSIGVVESKMPNLVTNAKDCDRNRSKSVNGGKLNHASFDIALEMLVKMFMWSAFKAIKLNLQNLCTHKKTKCHTFGVCNVSK